jgi:hypothetical protein
MWERSTIGIAWSEPGIESRLGRRGVMILKLLSQAFWIVFLCVAVVAVPSLWRKAGPAAILGNPCIWTCLILTILYSITSAQDRYHYPCTAFLAVLVGHYIALRRK